MKKRITTGVCAWLTAVSICLSPIQAMADTIIIPVNPDGTAAQTETAVPETTAPSGTSGVIYAPGTQDGGSSSGGPGETAGPGAAAGPGTSAGPQETTPVVQPGTAPGGTTDSMVQQVDPSGNISVSGAGLPAGTIDQSQLPAGDGVCVADDILKRRPFVITQLVDVNGVVDVYTMKTTLDEGQWNTVGDGFTGMKCQLQEGVGSIYYRVYTSATGWTEWGLNDTQTPSTNGARVEAFQMRLQGYTGNLYDMWYRAKLNDGTELGWTNNGKTAGTIGTGKYITAIQCMFWKKGVAFPHQTANFFEGAQYEGMIQMADGSLRYQKTDGTPYTGWAYVNNDKYYIKDNVPLTGWQYLDGYKFYFDASGKLVTDLEPIIGNPGDFIIKVNRQRNSFTIYTRDGDNGYILPYKVFLCTLNGTETPPGTYKFYAKYRWKYMHDGPNGRPIYCQFLNRFYNGYLVHSLIYWDKADMYHFDADTYNFLAAQYSDGCIRLKAGDAYWVYENCPNGTQITIYDDVWNIGPLDRPAIEQAIPSDQKYDPTDPLA